MSREFVKNKSLCGFYVLNCGSIFIIFIWTSRVRLKTSHKIHIRIWVVLLWSSSVVVLKLFLQNSALRALKVIAETKLFSLWKLNLLNFSSNFILNNKNIFDFLIWGEDWTSRNDILKPENKSINFTKNDKNHFFSIRSFIPRLLSNFLFCLSLVSVKMWFRYLSSDCWDNALVYFVFNFVS